jgi:heparanase
MLRSTAIVSRIISLFGPLLFGVPNVIGSAPGQSVKQTLHPRKLQKIATVDERFQSYNVEAVEVTGGRFWKPYGAANEDDVTQKRDTGPMFSGPAANMFMQRPALDLRNRRLRTLARALGPAYLRMSGSW